MTEIVVPALGESVTEATVAKWLKQPGEAVAVDEPLVELETDKVSLEVNATAAGTLSEILAKEGETVEVEARWQFHGRWSVVGFGGAGRAWTSNNRGSFQQSVGAGGVGFRYELARKFGMHVGLDFAASPDTRAVYLVVGNAWFRP